MVFRNPKVQHRIHKRCLKIPILSRITPVLHIDTISLRFILILSSRLCFPVNLFPIRLLNKILKSFLLSSVLATHLAHFNLIHLITQTILGERYQLWISSFWSLLHSPFLSFLWPNVRCRILFSKILILHASLNVRNYASEPYGASGNIIVLYVLILKFLQRSREEKMFGLNNNPTFYFLMNWILICQ